MVGGLRALEGVGLARGVVRGAAGGGGSGGVVFVFPGQGSQWVGMAVELLDCSPVFAERMVRCGEALAGLVDWSLEGVLRGVEGEPGLDRVDVVQPVLWAVMVSLAGLWEACGVRPAAVVGHSQGEIAAACVAVACRWRMGRGWWCRVAVRWWGCLGGVGWCRLGWVSGRWRSGSRVGVVGWGCGGERPGSVVVSGDVEALEGLLAELRMGV